MISWYIGELSDMTGVSKRTLYHYDSIGLLRPTLRMNNGYRVYSKNDLLKLQKIMILKNFGFELSKIQALLSGKIDMSIQLNKQLKELEERTKNIVELSVALKGFILDSDVNEDNSWTQAIKKINPEKKKKTRQKEKLILT